MELIELTGLQSDISLFLVVQNIAAIDNINTLVSRILKKNRPTDKNGIQNDGVESWKLSTSCVSFQEAE